MSARVTPDGFVPPEQLLGRIPRSIAVGFSGGADSAVLLTVLAEYAREHRIPVCAVHVDHNIRGEEGHRDRAFCENFCRERDIPLRIYSVDVPAERRVGESAETAARRLRYECFLDAMQKENAPVLALAHHADDQLETMLFRLARGTGLRGLCGIPPVREFGSGQIIRPLLRVTKQEILAFCRDVGLAYVTDSTNAQTDATRNRLRAEALPVLESVSHGASKHASRTAEILREDEEYLASAAKSLFHGGTLSRTALSDAPRPVALRALLFLCETAGADPDYAQLTSLYALCRSARVRARLSLPPRKIAVLVRDTVSVTDEPTDADTAPAPTFTPLSASVTEPQTQDGVTVCFDTPKGHPFPDGCPRGGKVEYEETEDGNCRLTVTTLVCDGVLRTPLVWVAPAPGDTVLSGGHHKLLRKLNNAKRIPPSHRRRIPVLRDKDGIVWAPMCAQRDGTYPQTADGFHRVTVTVCFEKGNDYERFEQ